MEIRPIVMSICGFENQCVELKTRNARGGGGGEESMDSNNTI